MLSSSKSSSDTGSLDPQHKLSMKAARQNVGLGSNVVEAIDDNLSVWSGDGAGGEGELVEGEKGKGKSGGGEGEGGGLLIK